MRWNNIKTNPGLQSVTIQIGSLGASSSKTSNRADLSEAAWLQRIALCEFATSAGWLKFTHAVINGQKIALA